MAGLVKRLRGWWNKDALVRAEEETRETRHERDVDEEDYEARKEEQAIQSSGLAGGITDYERDSEPPPKP